MGFIKQFSEISSILVISCFLICQIQFVDGENQQQLPQIQNATQSTTTSSTSTISSTVKKDLAKNSINNNNNENSNSTQKCVCDGALLPRVDENGKEIEICAHCKCKYENRNTTLIKVVVIIVIWIISILVIYMLFLMCLDPLLNKRVKANYQEHTNEDDDAGSTIGPTTMQMTTNQDAIGTRPNVLNRVGHQQDKWKRQVREQRKNIYDRRTMLN